MSYDALVWLLVGLGIGVAASLLLLLGTSMLEYGRLSRRFRKARIAAAAAAEPAEKAAPVAPKTSLLARPAARTEVAAKPAAVVTGTKPAVETKPTVGDKPPRPALVAVAAPEAKPATVTKPAAAAPVATAKPVIAASPEPVPEAPKRPKSVEAMFAEAFANDRLPASPEPDEAVGAVKPGAEKPPG
jgi:hypothetical protein